MNYKLKDNEAILGMFQMQSPVEKKTMDFMFPLMEKSQPWG